MIDPAHKTTVPKDWLLRVVALMNAMAGEGIEMEGCADPAILMCEIAESMGHGDAADAWAAVMIELGGAPDED